MNCPEFWLVAGPNGAGKTTCVQTEPITSIVPNVTFLNPDSRTLNKLQSLGYQGFSETPVDVQNRLFLESADEVFAELQTAISQCTPVGVETVLSSDKYRSLVEKVNEQGGFVGLIYIALSSPAMAAERVAIRVKHGGHGIPADKIEQRWKRSLQNLTWFAQRVTAFWVFDNSDADPAIAPPLVAFGRFGAMFQPTGAMFPDLEAALSPLDRV